MIELSLGKGVYIYESHITKAYSKQTATATARFLLSCFYNDEELIGKSLTGKNGKQCLNGDILESILSKGVIFLPTKASYNYWLKSTVTTIDVMDNIFHVTRLL